MGKHITPWPKRALWQVCTVHRRGTWSYPGEVGSELKLKDQHSQLGKRLRKGASTQREPEYPWPQISWSGSARAWFPWNTVSELQWLETAFAGSVHPDDQARALLGSKVNRHQGLVPLHCLPFKIQHRETWSPQAAFAYKTFLISYFSGGFNFKNGKQLFKILTKNTVHI